ncbi:urea carboxylase [Amycolatopsis deserti]|uniref:Urea carboxylase n=1 Tax=Amycolatopsis deserti TaxID=185696 RepID=A0ABQ3ID95_9PSEU|nr:urea amidolyase associated protein UAAP1 [Amycolatopsis deserti]GHE76660.1 urea carboxylase [Amycolatopsis deserti]
MSEILVSHEIPGGAAWSVLVRRGRELKLTATGAGANCSTLLFAAHHPVDRLNVPDTLKAQMSARIHAPMVLMSDRGAALCSVTGSSLDWHDALCGHSVDVDRFGPSSYAADRNAWRRSARDGFLSELRKHGRGPADLHACVNFFSKVATAGDTAGTLTFAPGHASAGDWVSLRMEMDVLVILSTAPHPLDPQWNPAAVLAEVRPAPEPGPDDPSWTFRDESARALRAAREVLA